MSLELSHSFSDWWLHIRVLPLQMHHHQYWSKEKVMDRWSQHSYLSFRSFSEKSNWSIIHPHVIPNLYDFLSSVENKRRYFEECYWQKKWETLWSFVFHRRKNCKRRWLHDDNFNFWVNYPFNIYLSLYDHMIFLNTRVKKCTKVCQTFRVISPSLPFYPLVLLPSSCLHVGDY